jgi:hypothetical protein
MLTITIPETEFFNEQTQRFEPVEKTTITLEHSLVSLSKWEQKWKKPFLGREQRTTPETLDYIHCMLVKPKNLPDHYFRAIRDEDITKISEYINDTMTATWFNDSKSGGRQSAEIVTAEIIYFWLIALQIDFRVEKWHLNRLLTLVRVVNIKNDPKKKMMPRKEQLSQQRDLNAERKARLGTTG